MLLVTTKVQRNYKIPPKRPKFNISNPQKRKEQRLKNSDSKDSKNQLNLFSTPEGQKRVNRKDLIPVLFHGSSNGRKYNKKQAGRSTKLGLHNLDKLAQLRKGQQNQGFPEGKNVNLDQKNDRNFFTQKQRAKAISFATASKLAALNSPLKKSYVNSLYCNSQIEKQDNKVTSRYCKNRFCPVCNRIRTAKLINTYVPIFNTWEELSFITLTIPSVPAHELRDSILRMERAFKKIVDVFRKRGTPLKAVRKTEVTYNSEKGYHPHFHIITEYLRGDIISIWKEHFPEISYEGQDIQYATEGSAKELFKYFSKVIFKGQFLPVVLDNIFQAVNRKRVFQSYGFTLTDEQKKAEEIEKLESQELTMKYYQDKTPGIYSWVNDERTWISYDGEILHPYKAEKKTEKLISKINGAKVPGDPDGASPGDQVPGARDQVPGDPDGASPGDQVPGARDQVPGDPDGASPGDQVTRCQGSGASDP
jgi:hypothetical protein